MVASPNVGCFLRLTRKNITNFKLVRHALIKLTICCLSKNYHMVEWAGTNSSHRSQGGRGKAIYGIYRDVPL